MNDRKVLVYEDDPATLEQIDSVLETLGVQMVKGDNPSGIIAAATESEPDLIILSADIKHGFSACLKVKKNKDLRKIPLFMIAGKTPPDVIAKHQRLPLRADVYLTTPLSAVMLTEILREQLPALPPQPNRTEPVEKSGTAAAPDNNTQAAGNEIDVGEIADRTMVTTHSPEDAMANFVESEVKGLKSDVVRLETEKRDLESMLKTQSETLTASLRAMQENTENLFKSSGTDSSAIRNLNELIDSAVREAVRKATEMADAEAEKDREKLENDLTEVLTENETLKEAADELNETADETSDLRKKIEKLEKKLEKQTVDAKQREKERKARADKKLADMKAETKATQELFEKLEGGYKATITGLEDEKDSLQEELSGNEGLLDELRSQVAEYEEMAEKFPALQEAAARNELLTSKNEKLKESVDTLQDRVDELETADAALKEHRKKLKKLKKSEEATRQELEDLTKKINQIKSLLGLSGLEGDDDSAEEPEKESDEEKAPEEDPA